MDGIESYSEWVKRYDDWVTLEPRPRLVPLKWTKTREEPSFEKEESSFGPSPSRIVFESPFYRDYQRYTAAAQDRDYLQIIKQREVPPAPTPRTEKPKPEEKVYHHDFRKAYDGIAREVIRRGGYGGFIYKPLLREMILKEEDTQEAIRFKADGFISDWSYWGLSMEEAKEVARRSKEILVNYLYDRIKGNDISSYAEYGEDLISYLPQVERSIPEIEAEPEAKEVKTEGKRREEIEVFPKRITEYAYLSYRRNQALLGDVPFPIFASTIDYAA